MSAALDQQTSRASIGGASVASTAKSLKSNYRVVAKTSQVDDSLFGGARPNGGMKPPQPGAGKGAPAAGRGLNDSLSRTAPSGANFGAGTRGGAHPPEIVTVSRSHLHKILEPSPILSAEQIATIKKDRANARDKEREVANHRKEMMRTLEERRKDKGPASETDLLKKENDSATRSRADYLMDEQRDEVKRMNQMMLYAKCVTIRDAQVEEKKHMMLEEEDENRRMDLLMEIDRLRALDAYEERERKRQEDRRKGAQVIIEQLREREKARIEEEELREIERKHMQAELERLRREDEERAAEKKRQAELLMTEVMRSNAEQLERKKLLKEQEKEEEHRIAEYIRLRDAREEAAAAERERLAKEKEMEVARLRAQQERAQDRQAELDELRARRYQEEAERMFREKEKQDAYRRAKLNQDLQEARERQMMAKLQQMAEMAEMERAEFLRILDANKEKEREEADMADMRSTIRHKYKEELLAQIHANDEFRKKDRQAYLEDGRRVRDELRRERNHLESIKERKLRELEAMGVPEKYRAELSKMKV